MGIPGAQHELVCTLISQHPHLIRELAVLTKVEVPRHDDVVTGPNSHQIREGSPIATDGTIRFLRDGKVVFFAQVEMQREYNLDKLATLRAYHGSEVRNTKVGGHMFVLSPTAAEVLKFRANEDRYREEFQYRSSHMSGHDLHRLAAPDQPYENRALAFAMTDFSRGCPAGAPGMLREMRDRNETIALLCLQAMIEECPDMTTVEQELDRELLEKLRQLKIWRDFEAELQAEVEAKLKAAEADAEAKLKAAQAKVVARKAQIAATAEAVAIAKVLIEYLDLRGDTPSAYALGRIEECRNATLLNSWLIRAYQGQKCADIFPDPQHS
jgi:hypothetical protein